MASQSIPSWNQIIVWLRDLESLRNAAPYAREPIPQLQGAQD